jgi:hypothetical protein
MSIMAGNTPKDPWRNPGTANTKVSSQMPAESQRLSQNYEQYIQSLKGNTGTAMENAMSKIRDAREGGKKTLTEGAMGRGIASTPDIGKWEEGTQAEMASAATDIGLGRESMIGEAMRGAPSIYESPYRLAQGEKGIGLQAAGLDLQREAQAQAAQESARQREFDNFMALLNAQRSSEADLTGYPVAGGYVGGGGSMRAGGHGRTSRGGALG